jgi:hypothetical protein
MKKSLKPIRKKIVKKNDIFRTIKHVYPHLNELSNKQIFDYYGIGSIKELQGHVEKIKAILLKREIINIEEIEETESCFCMDSRGEFKYVYNTKKEAEKQVQYSWKTKRVKLLLYSCPYHFGWHISKV